MEKYSVFVRWMLGFFFALTNSVLSQSAVFQFQAYMYTEDALRRPFEGNITVVCQIYDRSPDGVGTYCWRDSFPDVPVERGIFEVAIGSRKPLHLDDLRQCRDFPDSLFLDITAHIPGQPSEQFKPRRRLGAAIMTLFAQEAQVADSLRKITISDRAQAHVLLRLNEKGQFDPDAIPPLSQIDIPDSSINEKKIAAQAITNGHIREDAAINANKIDFGVKDFKIPEAAIPQITQNMLDDGAVSSVKIKEGAVDSLKIRNGTIIDEDINDDAHIQATKIDFTKYKLSKDVLPPITRDMLANGVVDSTKISNDAVSSAKIQDGAILNDDISDSAKINARKLYFDNDFIIPNAKKVNGIGVSIQPQDGSLWPLSSSSTNRLPGWALPSALESLVTNKKFQDTLNVVGRADSKYGLIVQKGIRALQTIRAENVLQIGDSTAINGKGYTIGLGINSTNTSAMSAGRVTTGIEINGTAGRTIFAAGKDGARFTLSSNAATEKFALEVSSRDENENNNALKVTGITRINGRLFLNNDEIKPPGKTSKDGEMNLDHRWNPIQSVGTARLKNGKAYVRFDAAFGQFAAPDSPIIITLATHGFAAGELRVMSRSSQGFDVELQPVPGWESYPTDVDFDWIAMVTQRR